MNRHPIEHFIFISFIVIMNVFLFRLVTGVQAEEPLTFDLDLSSFNPKLPVKLDDNQTILAKACKNDPKCVCISNAVFRMDSGWATMGVGKKTNNPGNLRPPVTWSPSVPFTIFKSPGNGEFAKFETLEDGIIANVETYQRFYSDMPAATLVKTWAQTKNSAYHAAVRSCFG